MALPDLIEIVPLPAPVRAEITVPGSKSITNRALVLAALADGEVTLHGALWSEDTQVMVECLQELGYMVNVAGDPEETCNRTITVYGLGGRVPRGGTAGQPLELFVGNAGTAARFLAALVCLGDGVYRLHGVPRMHERPQAALFQALRELGYRVEAEQGNDKLPALIFGNPAGGQRVCTVGIGDSSQFASALLLGSRQGGWAVRVVGENAEESPYVAMTAKLLEAFPSRGGTFQIEPDASSGSYFWALNEWEEILGRLRGDADVGDDRNLGQWPIRVRAWPRSGYQIDADFPKTLQVLSTRQRPWGSPVKPGGGAACVSRIQGMVGGPPTLGDSIMTAVVVTPIFSRVAVQYLHLGRLRVQECERVVALRTELTKCGAKVEEEGDTLTVYPSLLHGAEIETYNDHRMAMCFAILGLKVAGIKLKNPACVKKTFPNFFQKLAAAAPRGLGATILDGRTGRALSSGELFAD